MRELGFLYSQHWRIAPCLGKATQINAGARSVSSLTKLADAGAWLYSFAWLQGVRRETVRMGSSCGEEREGGEDWECGDGEGIRSDRGK